MGPFERHLREAIAINEVRAPKYQTLTNGESKIISNALILSEKTSLPYSIFLDSWSQSFRRKGVPIIEEEIVEMSLIPDFSEKYRINPGQLSCVSDRSGGEIAARVLKTYRLEGFAGAAKVCLEELRRIEEVPGFQVMIRHLLESTLRVANHAPYHEEHRKSLGIRASTLPLSKLFFFSHLSAFPFATWVDRRAFPIQSSGVPILFQDIPRIAPVSDFYSGQSR